MATMETAMIEERTARMKARGLLGFCTKRIIISCPHCGQRYSVRDKQWIQVDCQSCKRAFINPEGKHIALP